MKKKILIALAILVIPAIAFAANVGLGGQGLLLVILTDATRPDCPGTADINKGAMYYDSDDNKVLFCNGTDYQTLDTE